MIKKEVYEVKGTQGPPQDPLYMLKHPEAVANRGKFWREMVYGAKASARLSRYKTECRRFFGHSCLSFQTSYTSSVAD